MSRTYPQDGTFAPVSAPPPLPGTKHDQDKLRWDLLPLGALEQVVAALNHGARKYAPGNWRKLPGARRRFYAAALRHMVAWFRGEKLDPESGLHHLAHAMTCILFLLERETPSLKSRTKKKPRR